MKNNIKIAREQKGLTQQECADIFGVKLRAWQTYEQGVSEPKYELLCKIADTFDVTTDYLLGREEKAVPMLTDDDIDLESALLELFRSMPEECRKYYLDGVRSAALKYQNAETAEESAVIVQETTAKEYRKRLGLDDEAEAQDDVG